MVRVAAVLLLSSLGAIAGAPALAGPVTFEFLGVVDEVQDPNDRLHGAVVPGLVFTGSYTFESTAEDVLPGETQARYLVPPQQGYGIRVFVQTLIGFPPVVAQDDVVYVELTDLAGDLNDNYQVSTPDPQLNVPVPAGGSTGVDLVLRGPGALSGLDLPLVPPDLELFPVIHHVSIGAFSSDGFSVLVIRGPVVQLELPEPTSPGLAALATLACVSWRRQRAR
jgi:hypothetical protein